MCSLEFPDIDKQIYRTRKNKGVEVIGINPGKLMLGGEGPVTVKMFAKQTDITFPIGFDKGRSYLNFRMGKAISPFPLDVIIDKRGKVRYVKRRYDLASMRAMVDKLLAE